MAVIIHTARKRAVASNSFNNSFKGSAKKDEAWKDDLLGDSTEQEDAFLWGPLPGPKTFRKSGFMEKKLAGSRRVVNRPARPNPHGGNRTTSVPTPPIPLWQCIHWQR